MLKIVDIVRRIFGRKAKQQKPWAGKLICGESFDQHEIDHFKGISLPQVSANVYVPTGPLKLHMTRQEAADFLGIPEEMVEMGLTTSNQISVAEILKWRGKDPEQFAADINEFYSEMMANRALWQSGHPEHATIQ